MKKLRRLDEKHFWMHNGVVHILIIQKSFTAI